MTIHGELAKKYVKEWPETHTLTLANKLYKENPESFRDVEHARSMIRYYRGQHGKFSRENIKDKSDFKKGDCNAFKLPESHARPRTPTKIDGGKILALFDVHIPYHDRVAIEVAVDYGKKRDVDTILLGGDTIDCHQLSDYVKDPKKRRFFEELQDTIQFLGYLRDQFPKARIYYKEGNHEERFWRYMYVKAPELYNIKAFSIEELLLLSDYGIEWIDGRTKAMVAKLSIFHGHEFGGSVFSPVNVARGLYLRAKASAMCGHHHQTSEHSERNINDKLTSCWSVGCLSSLSPDYRPYNRWNHGFAIIETDGSDFHVENKRIYGGELL